MMTNDQKRLKIFLAISFGMPVILGILLGIAFYGGKDVNAFPLVWMFLPASAVMIASLATGKTQRDESGEEVGPPKVFFGTFLAFAAALIICAVLSAWLPGTAAYVAANFLVIFSSLVCLIELLCMKKQRRKAWGLSLTASWKKSLLGVLTFALLYLILSGLSIAAVWILTGSMQGFSLNPYWAVNLATALPLNFVLSFTAFLGEEYGWRYFLQGELIQRFGRRKGVILLGLLWGVWHLPLNLFYYSPQTSLQSIITQLAGCVGMGIFFGWVYLRTRNVWAVTSTHFLNNNLGLMLFGVSAAGVTLGWGDTLLSVALYMIVYLPFLLTKEFRKEGQ